MELFWKLPLGLALAAALLWLFWLLRGVMLTPVKLSKQESLRLVLAVRGSDPDLERTADALLWLMADGVLPGELVIRDLGMDDETRRRAVLLARDNRRVTLWTRESCSN